MEHNHSQVCLHEDQIQQHNLELTGLQTEIQFKKEKIDQIIDDQQKMADKLDTLLETVNNMQMKSIMGDNDLNNRVTSIESELSTVRWMLGITLTVLGLTVTVLAFILTHLH